MCSCNQGRQLLLHELLLAWHKGLARTANNSPDRAAAAAPAHATEDRPADVAIGAAQQQQHGKMVAFLLLVQHLAGFYQLEQQRFKQRLAATLRASSAAADEDAAGSHSRLGRPGSSAVAAAGGPSTAASRKRAANGKACSDQEHDQRQKQQQQDDAHASKAGETSAAAAAAVHSSSGGVFDYMLDEEERQCVEASTAEFTASLLADTAPACYLPLLSQLLTDAMAPTHIKVGATRALLLPRVLAACATAGVLPVQYCNAVMWPVRDYLLPLTETFVILCNIPLPSPRLFFPFLQGDIILVAPADGRSCSSVDSFKA